MRVPGRARPLALSALLALAACGGGDEAGNGGGGGGGTASTAASTAGSTAAQATTSPVTVDISSRVERFPVTSQSHVAGTVDYSQKPPVGGNHNAVWVNCGFYSRALTTEQAVHSMEHGAAWITFRPTASAADRAVLRALATSNRYVLASPWADESLPAPIVVSAWGLQLKVDTASDPALTTFVKLYADGPQTPEKGAPCSGGIGTPE